MRCFKCEKSLELFDESGGGDWIDEGMRFSSPGGYGSRVYDGNHSVIINVCDDCFTDAASKQLIQTQRLVKRAEPAVIQYVVWNSELDD